MGKAMKDGVMGQKTIAALQRGLNRWDVENRFKMLENERRLAFRDYLITGNVGWYKQVSKQLDMLIGEIVDMGGSIHTDRFCSVIVWGD